MTRDCAAAESFTVQFTNFALQPGAYISHIAKKHAQLHAYALRGIPYAKTANFASGKRFCSNVFAKEFISSLCI